MLTVGGRILGVLAVEMNVPFFILAGTGIACHVPASHSRCASFSPGVSSAVFAVMIASECAPAAQAGGLGQVVFGLSRELELRGHALEIILPKYDCMRYDQIFGLTVAYPDLWVPWYGVLLPNVTPAPK